MSMLCRSRTLSHYPKTIETALEALEAPRHPIIQRVSAPAYISAHLDEYRPPLTPCSASDGQQPTTRRRHECGQDKSTREIVGQRAPRRHNGATELLVCLHIVGGVFHRRLLIGDVVDHHRARAGARLRLGA